MTGNLSERDQVCRVCGKTDSLPWKQRNLDRSLTPDDFMITDARYGVTLSLLRCRECGFIYADDGEVDQLTEFYRQINDPSYEEGEGFRGLQMRWLLRHCRAARPDARTLLDVGAAAGLLLREAEALDFEAEGVEPSESLSETARNAGLAVHQGVLPHESLEGRKFEVVTAIDVIEHVADPVALMKISAAYLAPDGILAIVTPDVGSIAARLFGQRWWHLRLAHVCYFNRHSLEAAIASAGLRIVGRRRAKWFFEMGYLADRVAQYLPVAGLNRVLRKTPLVRSLYELVIPLNLFDSFFYILERDNAAAN